MVEKLNEASLWRIEFATELVQYYIPQKNIRMIVLGGSPPKGLSDSYSDLDIVVYWDNIDFEWLESVPLKQVGGDRFFLRRMSELEEIYLEQYYFNGLKVDIGHVTMKMWNHWVEDVMVNLETTPDKQKSLGGFLDSKALHGEDLVNEWKERIATYPEELGRRMIKQNFRFFVHGSLVNQGYKRDDLLFFHDGLCLTLKKMLGILAGLNRIYFSTDDPRWIAYELERMPIKPKDAWKRMKAVLESDGEKAVGILDGLVDDMMDLVEKHVPGIDLTKMRRGIEKGVMPCESKPVLKRA